MFFAQDDTIVTCSAHVLYTCIEQAHTYVHAFCMKSKTRQSHVASLDVMTLLLFTETVFCFMFIVTSHTAEEQHGAPPPRLNLMTSLNTTHGQAASDESRVKLARSSHAPKAKVVSGTRHSPIRTSVRAMATKTAQGGGGGVHEDEVRLPIYFAEHVGVAGEGSSTY
ncbi:hypothetical protein HD806DRAFT_188795 [Xylariaceae sp. AK1471]|nr:hypothetical protein HD806DRAFT_188795 [Xylariaceae sp. AK1471]